MKGSPFIGVVSVMASLALAVSASGEGRLPEHLPPKVLEQSPALTDTEARAATKPVRASKIILVGDSTVQSGSGWGGAFCARHAALFSCLNLGRGGRSTLSYRLEGSWDMALAEAQVAGYQQVYILIQFGHNDQPGVAGRRTDLETEFPQLLRQYVNEARAAGAIPVLVTPLTRRSFRAGALQDGLKPWADSIKQVAAEMQVPLVDLHGLSVDAVQAMGPVRSMDMAQILPPADVIEAVRASGTTIDVPRPERPARTMDGPLDRTGLIYFDYTHIGPQGAEFFAAQVTDGLAKAVPELGRQLVK